MRVLVYQSFRTRDVPSWVSICMDSVRAWATQALLHGNTALLQHYMQAFGHPVHAANLCTTYIDKPYFGVTLSNPDFDTVVAMLLNSRGAVLNRLLPGG